MLHDSVIFDSSVIIDMCLVDEWGWFKKHYAKLCVAELLLLEDKLGSKEKNCISQHFISLDFSSDEEFNLFSQLSERYAGLSRADRATITLSKTRMLECASDDGKMVKTCELMGIKVIRTLNILSEMNETGFKGKAECCRIVKELRGKKRNKFLTDQVVSQWENELK